MEEATNLKTTPLKLMGKGQILPYLRESISQAEESIMIVGPWLDAYFTRQIINSLTNKEIEVEFVVRIDDSVIDKKTLSALNLAHQNIKNFQAKSLENLHSKVILIDKDIFCLGSANWYWFSLNESLEVTIKGDISMLPELIPQLDQYWKDGSPITEDEIKDYKDFEPIYMDIHHLKEG